jgi:ABC-type Zn2+ transport system substrate-binding protein/surface adhesin
VWRCDESRRHKHKHKHKHKHTRLYLFGEVGEADEHMILTPRIYMYMMGGIWHLRASAALLFLSAI